MQVKIALTGPAGSGKTVLAQFIERQLQPFCVSYEIRKGSEPGSPQEDSIILQTTPELLAKIANT